jgi:hypothetical protein
VIFFAPKNSVETLAIEKWQHIRDQQRFLGLISIIADNQHMKLFWKLIREMIPS